LGEVSSERYDPWVADSKRELEAVREELSNLDASLVATLDKRARLARRLGESLIGHPPSLSVDDHERLRMLVQRSAGDMPARSLEQILRRVFSECIPLERPVSVVFVGPAGGTGHVAALDRFGRGATLTPVASVPLGLGAVANGRAEYLVAPFETTEEGPVHATIRALFESDLRIGEVIETTLELHLLNRSGSFSDIRTVYSTAGERALCAHFLASMDPAPAIVEVPTPWVALEHASAEASGAAIASDAFAAEHRLEVARGHIVDRGTERLRCAVIGNRPSRRTGEDATSIVFGVGDAAGALGGLLQLLSEHGVVMTKIGSFPMPGSAWSYGFFAEVIGHFTDRPLVVSFEEMRRAARFFRVLGSYPAP
jgi:chorismate mutase/prephenate dehydratase